MNRLKIVSNGLATGTQLIDTKTGEDVTRAFLVEEISWHMGCNPRNPYAEVTLKVRMLPAQIEGRITSLRVREWLNEHSPETEDGAPGFDEFPSFVVNNREEALIVERDRLIEFLNGNDDLIERTRTVFKDLVDVLRIQWERREVQSANAAS